jgi:DNA-binding response OmpR family regulator
MALRLKGDEAGHMDSENPNSKKTILLADDDGPLRKFLAVLLTKLGYNLIVAADGKEALEKALAFDGRIDLLLSDVEMPEMTGIELAIQLNAARPDIRVLLISGLASGVLVLNSGWQFLPKPFMSDMLRDRIRDFLAEQSPITDHLLGSLSKPDSAGRVVAVYDV